MPVRVASKGARDEHLSSAGPGPAGPGAGGPGAAGPALAACADRDAPDDPRPQSADPQARGAAAFPDGSGDPARRPKVRPRLCDPGRRPGQRRCGGDPADLRQPVGLVEERACGGRLLDQGRWPGLRRDRTAVRGPRRRQAAVAVRVRPGRAGQLPPARHQAVPAPARRARKERPMILVTGATGKVGRHVVAGLLAEGAPVRALTRGAPAAGLPAGAGIACWDPGEPDTLAAALAGATAVFINVTAVGGVITELMGTAARAGARRAVMLSSFTVRDNGVQPYSVGAYHKAIEEAVSASPLAS